MTISGKTKLMGPKPIRANPAIDPWRRSADQMFIRVIAPNFRSDESLAWKIRHAVFKGSERAMIQIIMFRDRLSYKCESAGAASARSTNPIPLKSRAILKQIVANSS
jgi:hypothetical protein